jgi:hypothetical protein
MVARAPRPVVRPGEHHIPPDLREVFRYRKADRTRIYNLRVLPTATELWTVSEQRGRIVKSQKKVTFDRADDIAPFLEDVQRELRAGGWSCSRPGAAQPHVAFSNAARP